MRSEFTQFILDEIDIVQLVSEDVTIKGNKANCPFPDHEDANPSFTVYPPDGFYCFGCSKGGTAIDYIMYRDNVTAGEAIRYLCEKYNIPMPDWTPEQQAEFEQRKSEKEIVEKILADAFAFYHDNMTEEQRAYFRSRGLTDETIDKELLGYAPEGNVLFAHLNGKYTPDQLLLSGLFIKVKGAILDFYRDRYVFPYFNRGQIVYSIGRSLDPDIEEHKKYIKQMTHKENHPYVSDTVQNVIWNSDGVRAFKQGIIAEGIIDGLHAKQIGTEIDCGVISPVTKQFRGADIDSLVKLTKAWETIFIFPDNEKSGEGVKGALKTAETLFEEGRDVRLVMLPRPEDVEKVDLADLLNVPEDQREARIDELNQLMNEAPDFIEWKINEVVELPERDKPRATKEIIELLTDLDHLAQERYADLLQSAKLLPGKRAFWTTLKEIRLEKKAQMQIGYNDPQRFMDNHTFIPKWLADEVMENEHFIYAGEMLYRYVDGIYQPDGEAFVAQKCQQLLGRESRRNRVDEVLFYIQTEARRKVDELNIESHLINLENGMWDWIEQELKSHDPKYLSTIRIPVKYDPNATCPEIDRFFKTTLPSDCIDLAEELFGYCLIPDIRFQKATMLVGEGANGKSTFINLLCAFVGEDNVSKVPLQELEENRFAKAELFGKLVNVFADLDTRALRKTGTFKALTGGDPIQAERKFKNPFSFRPFARLVFSANQMPKSRDQSFAYYRRWNIIPFPNQFIGDAADKALLHKLTRPSELSGLLNKALEGLHRLFANEDFSQSTTTQAALEEYKRENDSVLLFVDECCILGEKYYAFKQKLYDEYRKYCEEMHFPPDTHQTFNKRLQAEFPSVTASQEGTRRIWRGIGILEK